MEKVQVRYPDLEKACQEAWSRKDYQRAKEIQRELSGSKTMMTTLIADVHTDQNSMEVLEEGTGWVDLVVVCYRQPDGRLVLGAGPGLSYYEFRHPMKDRLTGEKWVEMLSKGKAPRRPEWTKAFAR